MVLKIVSVDVHNDNAQGRYGSASMQTLDSPSTTSAITYTIYYYTGNSTGSIFKQTKYWFIQFCYGGSWMSTLKVNNIDTQTGSNIVVASGKVLSASGHIIQVLRTYAANNNKQCSN